MTYSKSVRQFYIDWIRVISIIIIFLFHCARFFNNEDWHVKNYQLDLGMSYFVEFISKWIMPLFFFLSGISSYFALAKGNKEYIKSRVKRLLVPLLFGMFIIIAPIQVWMERVSHGQFSGSFIDFMPNYFNGFYGFGGNFAWFGIHLWYLEMLFLFSIITLPLFIFFRKRINPASENLSVKLSVLLFPLLIIITELLVNLNPETIIGRRELGGWSLVTYLAFFICGYLVNTRPEYFDIFKKFRFLSLMTAIILTITYLIGKNTIKPGAMEFYFTESIIRGLVSWFWIMAIIGIGKAYLTSTNRFLTYANEAVLPFYILHQTIIVSTCFYIANWEISVLLKYFFLSTVSFVIIIALYEFVIRRINIVRIIFGMKKI
ncbi:MAG: acyltransferase family protein [bacterium]|nr:acyltransferase family protein [bacterium]